MAGKQAGRPIRGEQKARERITLLVTETEFNGLKEYAKSKGHSVTVSSVLREILQDALPKIFKPSK